MLKNPTGLKMFIKTECGIKTFELLNKKKGFLNRLRLIQFTMCAIFVDFFKWKN